MQTRVRLVRPMASPTKKPLLRMLWWVKGRALGESGGAGGVLDVNGVVELHAASRRPRSAAGTDSPDARKASPRRSGRRGGGRDSTAGRRRARGRRRGGGSRGRGTGTAAAGLTQGVLQLGGLVGGVDVDEDGADAGGGVLDDDPLMAVGRPDADAVAGRDAGGEEVAGGLRDRVPIGGRYRGSSGDRPRSRHGGRGGRRRRRRSSPMVRPRSGMRPAPWQYARTGEGSASMIRLRIANRRTLPQADPAGLPRGPS